MNDQKWFITRTRFIPATYPLLAFFDWKCGEYFNISNSGHILHIWENGHYFAVWEKEKYAEFGEHALDKLLEIGDMKKVRAISTESGESLVAYCKEYAEFSTTPSIDGHIKFIVELSKRYSELMKDNMCYWLFAPQIIEKRIRALLIGKTDEQKDEIIHTLSHPKEESYSQSVEKEFSVLVDAARSVGLENEEFVKKVDDFSSKYFWFPYEYVGPGVWSRDSVIKRISGEISKPVTRDTDKNSSDQSIQNRIIEQYQLSAEVVKLFEIWQMMALLQDDRKKYNAQVSFYINDVISKKIAESFNISFEQARYLDKSILCILKTNRDEFETEMSARMELFIVDELNNAHMPYSSMKARKYLESLGIRIKEDVKDVGEVKGQIAYKGKVTGRVRVLKTSQVSDFADGDIIVTGMTTPDFAPLMKKAVAIVTDEGGITCHAAIVSRELKKPCVIGTKIATQVFKDGDMIEVDANTGVVKLIN